MLLELSRVCLESLQNCLESRMSYLFNTGHFIPSPSASHTQLLPLTGTRPEGTLPQHCQFITNISQQTRPQHSHSGTGHGHSCWQLILFCSWHRLRLSIVESGLWFVVYDKTIIWLAVDLTSGQWTEAALLECGVQQMAPQCSIVYYVMCTKLL